MPSFTSLAGILGPAVSEAATAYLDATDPGSPTTQARRKAAAAQRLETLETAVKERELQRQLQQSGKKVKSLQHDTHGNWIVLYESGEIERKTFGDPAAVGAKKVRTIHGLGGGTYAVLYDDGTHEIKTYGSQEPKTPYLAGLWKKYFEGTTTPAEEFLLRQDLAKSVKPVPESGRLGTREPYVQLPPRGGTSPVPAPAAQPTDPTPGAPGPSGATATPRTAPAGTTYTGGGAWRTAQPSGAVLSAVREAAQQTGVPVEQLLGVAAVESALNPGAIGRMTRFGWEAKGLMQLSPDTAARMAQGPVTERDLFNPPLNAYLGALAWKEAMQKAHGDVRRAYQVYYNPHASDHDTNAVLASIARFQEQFASPTGGGPAIRGHGLPQAPTGRVPASPAPAAGGTPAYPAATGTPAYPMTPGMVAAYVQQFRTMTQAQADAVRQERRAQDPQGRSPMTQASEQAYAQVFPPPTARTPQAEADVWRQGQQPAPSGPAPGPAAGPGGPTPERTGPLSPKTAARAQQFQRLGQERARQAVGAVLARDPAHQSPETQDLLTAYQAAFGVPWQAEAPHGQGTPSTPSTPPAPGPGPSPAYQARQDQARLKAAADPRNVAARRLYAEGTILSPEYLHNGPDQQALIDQAVVADKAAQATAKTQHQAESKPLHQAERTSFVNPMDYSTPLVTTRADADARGLVELPKEDALAMRHGNVLYAKLERAQETLAWLVLHDPDWARLHDLQGLGARGGEALVAEWQKMGQTNPMVRQLQSDLSEMGISYGMFVSGLKGRPAERILEKTTQGLPGLETRLFTIHGDNWVQALLSIFTTARLPDLPRTIRQQLEMMKDVTRTVQESFLESAGALTADAARQRRQQRMQAIQALQDRPASPPQPPAPAGDAAPFRDRSDISDEEYQRRKTP